MVGQTILASQPAGLRITFGCWRWISSPTPTVLNKALRTSSSCLLCLAFRCMPITKTPRGKFHRTVNGAAVPVLPSASLSSPAAPSAAVIPSASVSSTAAAQESQQSIGVIGSVNVEYDDDASSVEGELANAADATFPFHKCWPTFLDLSATVSAFASLTHAFTMCDNSRSRAPSMLPTAWLKRMFEGAKESIPVKYSGFLYCSHKCESSESGACSFKVPYKLNPSGSWQVLENAVWQHSHTVDPIVRQAQSASGIVHIFTTSDLCLEHKMAIFNFLESGLSVKLTRRKFREKFAGFEVRARCVKTLKEQFLREKYGGDRHQINELLKKIGEDCGGIGGTCHIEHSQTLELEQLYFQIPMLREVGRYFGRFSIIDTTHGTTMYDRQLATFNVCCFVMCLI